MVIKLLHKGSALLVLLLVAMLPARAQTLSTSLTACYAFDGNGNEPIGNLTATLGAVTSTVNRFNNTNSALYFNGTNSSIVRMPGNAVLQPTNEISVAAWIKPTLMPSGVGCYILFTKNTASTNFEAYSITINNISPGVSKFAALKGAGGLSSVCLSSTSIVANTWYHVAMTMDNSTIKIYVNGALESTISTTLNFSYDPNHDVYFGGTNESYNLPFTGIIDNAKFYNRILSASEVSQLYSLDPNCTFTPGQAINFDGVNDYVDPNILITNVSNNFTYEIWARPTATHEIDAQSSSGTAGVFNQRYLIWPVWRNNEAGIGISAGTNGVSVYEHGSNFMNSLLTYTGSLNAWTHIAVVVTNKQPSLYINGTLVQTGLTSSKTNVYPSLGEVGQFVPNVGGIGGGTYGSFAGDADEFRLWNSAISQTQIAAYINTEFSCPMSGLIAYYKFNEGLAFSNNSTVTTTPDYSGNNYTATLTLMSLNGNSSNRIAPGATVIPTSSFTLQASASSPSICASQNVTLSASGASTYTWLPGNSNGATLVVSPTATSIYTVFGANSSSCTLSKTLSVVVQSPQSLSISASPTVICSGASVTLSASTNGSCTWQPGNLSGTLISVSPNTSTTYSASSTGTNGCVSNNTVSVIVNPSVSLSATVSASNVCQGDVVILSGGGANSYTWQPGNLTGQTVTVSPGSSTTYTLSGANTSSCVSTLTFSINVSNTPSITASANPSIVCVGNSATLTANGATSYTWLPVNLTGSQVIVNPLTPTQYTLIGANGNCTTAVNQFVNVINNPVISASASPSLVCAGDPCTLTANGAGTYTWSPGNIVGSSVVVNPLTATVYTVTGGNGACTASATTQVGIGLLVSISASGNLCNNSSVVLNASPFTSSCIINWAGPGIVGSSTSQSITANAGGIYTASITNTISGCSGTATYNLVSNTNPLAINIIPSSTVACFPGPPVNMLVSASMNFTWLPVSQVTPVTGPLVSVNPSVSTSYTVLGTLGSCSSSAAITISVNPTPTVSISASQFTACSLSTVTLVATGASEYLWTPGNQSGSSLISVPYSSTVSTQVYTVTGFIGLCTHSQTYSLQVFPTPVLTAFANPSSICIGNSSTLSASGAISYTWLPQNVNSVSVALSPSVSAVYTVSGSNTFSCSSTATVFLNVINSPAISANTSSSLICSGESVTLTSSGATSYTWVPGFLIGSSVVVNPTVSTIYTVNSSNSSCSYATVLVSVQNCVNLSLGLSNYAGTPVPSGSNYFRIPFIVTAGNSSAYDLKQLSLKDDLRNTFPYPANYTLSTKPVIISQNSGLSINPNYDGSSDLDLIVPASGTLAAMKRDTIRFDLLVDPMGFTGTVKNSVFGTAIDHFNFAVSDSSNSGFDLDPDSDGNPTNNNTSTLIELTALELFIPEGFSPNNDGNNDLFIIGGLNGKTISFNVFNRWGNKVYEKDNYDNTWDGTLSAPSVKIGSGKLPEGTYYYIIRFSDNSRSAISGFLVLSY